MKQFSKATRPFLALLACCSIALGAPRVLAQQQNAPVAASNQPEWRADGSGAGGIRALSGSDGFTTETTRGGSRALTTQAGTTPSSLYLYFDVDDARAQTLKGPLYLSVEYFDATPGGVIGVDYDSATGAFLQAEDQAGGWMTGSGRWKTAILVLQAPRLENRQNVNADFRLNGGPLLVRRLQLSTSRPANWNQVNIVETVDVKPLVKIGAGGQFIIGGFDSASAADGPRQARALESSVPAMKALGVTSHEAYIRWNLCEPQPGKYDWSVYDNYVRVYKKHGLKWVPFLIVGSAYSLPDWYYKKPGSQGYVCLEHNETSDVESLWNPELRGHLARFIKAFSDRYRNEGVIETVLLGITGNYGEAIYIASGNDWTADRHGQYHTHGGFWAGDPFAVADFRRALRTKYKDDAALTRAWGKPTALASVRPFLKKDAPGDRAWLDFVDWYIGSMNDYTRFWMQETRKNFPKHDIQICTGGHAPPEHGADFGEQCKIGAEFGGGVRITNEASNYAANFSVTRWVASAARQYGATFSFEPAGEVNPLGVIRRIYNASASGADGLHYYHPNLFAGDEARGNFARWGSFFRQNKPVVEVAVFYPQTHIKLNGNDFLPLVQSLRERFDFDYMSDGQIRDGGLARSKALILMQGAVSEAATWQRITEWVRSGGVLLYADGIGKLRSVEGDESFHDALFGANANLGKGRVLVFSGAPSSAEFRAFVSRNLASAKELSRATRAMIATDGKEDGVYVSVSNPNELLWLNTTDNEVRAGMSPLVLAPQSITAQRVSAR